MPYSPVYYGSDKLMAQVIPSLPGILAFVWASGGDDLGYQVVKGIGDAIWCHGCIVVTSSNLDEAAKDGGEKKKITAESCPSDKEIPVTVSLCKISGRKKCC
jgi:hypothetical protein